VGTEARGGPTQAGSGQVKSFKAKEVLLNGQVLPGQARGAGQEEGGGAGQGSRALGLAGDVNKGAGGRGERMWHWGSGRKGAGHVTPGDSLQLPEQKRKRVSSTQTCKVIVWLCCGQDCRP